MTRSALILIVAGAALFFLQAALAQEATQSGGRLDRSVLPIPEPPFKGKIGRTAADSVPDFPKGVEAPEGAPNVLLILTDDVGFGASSTFGGPIQTPNLQRLADAGLRYNMFHTTALCSPTRAALILGRNHHSVHSGVITEFATGYPGYNSLVPKSAGSVGEVLKENGYNTSWFGKAHNVPDWMSSQAGPFDLWPVGLGFEYFYGFLGGDSDQWHPACMELLLSRLIFVLPILWFGRAGILPPAMSFSGRRAQAPSRSVGAPTSTYTVRWPDRTLTVASTAASCRGVGGWREFDPRGARFWRASLHEPSLCSVLSIWIATMKQSSASVAKLRGGGAILSTALQP